MKKPAIQYEVISSDTGATLWSGVARGDLDALNRYAREMWGYANFAEFVASDDAGATGDDYDVEAHPVRKAADADAR